MYIWYDYTDHVDLMQIEGLKIQDHPFFSKYEAIILKKGEVHFYYALSDLVDDEEDYEEIYKYKVLDDESWKIQALCHFAKVLADKKIELSINHCVLTSRTDGFLDYTEYKKDLLIIGVGEDPEMPGWYTWKEQNRFSMFLKDKITFVDEYRLKWFESSEFNDNLIAIQELINWYQAGMPEQTIELWNITAVAEHFGKLRQNIHRDCKAGKLPAPFAIVKNVPYWHPKQSGELARALNKI